MDHRQRVSSLEFGKRPLVFVFPSLFFFLGLWAWLIWSGELVMQLSNCVWWQSEMYVSRVYENIWNWFVYVCKCSLRGLAFSICCPNLQEPLASTAPWVCVCVCVMFFLKNATNTDIYTHPTFHTDPHYLGFEIFRWLLKTVTFWPIWNIS